MTDDELPTAVQLFLSQLISQRPAPTEIWLLGSRANGAARADSDTDLLVFGSNELFVALCKISAPAELDCFVVVDSNTFKDPWKEKSGTLSGWKWERLQNGLAQYEGTFWIPDEDDPDDENSGTVIAKQFRALLLWPRRSIDPCAQGGPAG